ncbi:type II secretion system protein [Sphingobium cupriresistens]|nr:prepilin-type N-terminal cleavage/methylation domain-containing protein [Sphingobium cupriresistens]
MRAAFSLVELSIVLVILGLLTGGILAGQSLIRAAELRAIPTEYDRWVAATQVFRDRYMALPGDMRNATAFWGFVAGNASDNYTTSCNTTPSTDMRTCNGNGDGKSEASIEGFRFWQHLANAGLAEGNFTGMDDGGFSVIGKNIPASKFGGGSGWQRHYISSPYAGTTHTFAGKYGSLFVFGKPSPSDYSLRSGVLGAQELWNIDTKMDDGRPATGNVRAYNYGPPCTDTAADPTNMNAQYQLDSNTRACAAYFIDR